MEDEVNASETQVSSEPQLSRDEIARRAYEIWQARGCPPTDGSEDWQAAEQQLTAERVSRNGSTQDRMQSWLSRVRQKIKR
jgi:hypothetical protein